MEELVLQPTSMRKLPVETYNFRHFRPRHLWYDAKLTVRAAGLVPGQMAPDFELPVVEGDTLRLSDLRGRPVLVRFGSFT